MDNIKTRVNQHNKKFTTKITKKKWEKKCTYRTGKKKRNSITKKIRNSNYTFSLIQYYISYLSNYIFEYITNEDYLKLRQIS